VACCKIGSVVEKEDLHINYDGRDIHEYLVARWVGKEDYPAVGVRKLTDWFNKKLLREVYTSHGRSVTDVRISSEYEAFSGDENLKKTELIDDLRADGIDGQKLIDDFVSKSTMRRHLTDCLGISKKEMTPDSETETNWERQRIQFGEDYLKSNVEEAIQSLTNKHQLPGGDKAKIDIEVFLSCPHCSTQVRLQTALERGYICQKHLSSVPSVNT